MDLIEKINSGRQYRNLILECRKKEEDSNEESYVVRGYATTFNEPYTLYSDGDMEIREQVAPDAFNEADMEDVIFQYDHAGRVYARISNKTLTLTQDDHGLLIEADLGGTEEGRKLYEEIKGGYTNKMSFGFTVSEDEYREFTEDEKRIYLRTIKRIGKLYDVSAVSLPANDGTEISARNLVDGVIAKVEAERLLNAENEKRQKMEMLETRIKKIELEIRINGNQRNAD